MSKRAAWEQSNYRSGRDISIVHTSHHIPLGILLLWQFRFWIQTELVKEFAVTSFLFPKFMDSYPFLNWVLHIIIYLMHDSGSKIFEYPILL